MPERGPTRPAKESRLDRGFGTSRSDAPMVEGEYLFRRRYQLSAEVTGAVVCRESQIVRTSWPTMAT